MNTRHIRYTVKPNDVDGHYFDVTLNIPKDIHLGKDLKLQLPAWIPGSYMLRDFSKHLERITGNTLIKKIDHLKVYRTQNERISIQMRLTTEKYAKTAGLEDLISASEGGKKVKILGRQSVDETKLKELLLFVEGNKTDDTVLMTITGDFDLNEVPALTDKMKIPGSDELRKAVKK